MNTNTIDNLSIPDEPNGSTAVIPNSELNEKHVEYARFLSGIQPWRWWFTGTFASPVELNSCAFEAAAYSKRTGRSVQPEGAVKAFERHLRHAMCLSAEPDGGAYRKPTKYGFKWVGSAPKAWDRGRRPQYVLTLERNKHNAGVHIHALVADHPDWPITFDAMRSWWDSQGMGRTEEIRPGETRTMRKTGETVSREFFHCFYALKYSLKLPDCDLVLAPWLKKAPSAPISPSLARDSERSERELLISC